MDGGGTVVPAWGLGIAWGILAALPLGLVARGAAAGDRAAALVPRASRRRAPRGRWATRPLGPVGRVASGLSTRRRTRRDEAVLIRELPVLLDLLGLAVGAGCTPFLALEVAARWAPPATAARVATVVRSCRLGVRLVDALREGARACPVLAPAADVLVASETTGAPAGPALARLAAEARSAARRRAEAHARTVPVRLLFPLVFLVLPAFGLLTVVPALLAGLARS